MHKVLTIGAPLFVLFAVMGCSHALTGAAANEQHLIDPDNPPYPPTPPPGLSLDQLNHAIRDLRHQNQYSTIMIREYPGNAKGTRVKAYTDGALAAYGKAREDLIARQMRDGTFLSPVGPKP